MSKNFSVNTGTDYIYHIHAGGSVYVGQTSQQGLTRIEQHFRNAYYHERHNIGKRVGDIYDKMRQYRMQDICVEIYPSTADYGIPNLQQKYQAFCQEGVPTNTNKITPLLDFAEVFHTMYLLSCGKSLTNVEVGGRKIQSWTYAGMVSNNSRAILTSRTPLQEAYRIIKKGGMPFAQVQNLTANLIDMIFDKNGPGNISNSIFIQSISPTFRKTLPHPPANCQQSGYDYVTQSLGPYILSKQVLNTAIQAGNNSLVISQDNIQRMAKAHMGKNFFQPRRAGIITLLRNQPEFLIQKTVFQPKDIQLKPVADYLAVVLRSLIVESYNKTIQNYQITGAGSSSQQKTIARLANIVPARISVFGNLQGKRKQPFSGSGLSGPLNSPILLPKQGYQYRSLLFFDGIYHRANRQPLNLQNYIITPTASNNTANQQSIGSVLQTNVVYMQTVFASDTLSSAMRQTYMKFCPAYTRNGLKFYRPMVSAGRKEREKPSFQHYLDYHYYGDNSHNAYLVYKAKIGEDQIDYSNLQIY